MEHAAPKISTFFARKFDFSVESEVQLYVYTAQGDGWLRKSS